MADVELAVAAAAAVPETQEIAAEGDAAAVKAPHKLQRQWTFWYDIQSKPKPGAPWGTSLKKGYTFDTVEEFWSLYDQIFRPSKLQGNADFHLFKAGVEPKWEDPECANGGKWTVISSRKTALDTMWLETCMALIGEQFDESQEICGVVASVRQRQDKLSLWTKTASNEAVQIRELEEVALSFSSPGNALKQTFCTLSVPKYKADLVDIGKKWKEVIDYNDKMVYSFHDDSRSQKPSRGGRYTV